MAPGHKTPRPRCRRLTWPLAAFPLAPMPAFAHAFGQVYTPPIPLQLYLYAAALVLILSFLLFAGFTGLRCASVMTITRPLPQGWHALAGGPALFILRGAALAMLLLTMVSGIAGNQNPYSNFSMTAFWVIFVIGYAYVVAVLGDSYALLNPWRTLVRFARRVLPVVPEPRTANAPRWAYAPALTLYIAFVWLELFAHIGPAGLGMALLAYTALTLVGCYRWGTAVWFRYGDFFSVFFRVLGMMAPLEKANGCLRLRLPFAGLLREPCEHAGLLVFVLFMLSSTAFDAIHKSAPWLSLFVEGVLPVARHVLGAEVAADFAQQKRLALIWQSAALMVSPLLYLALYAAFLWLGKRLTRSALSLRSLCLAFCFPLVPIAFVYHAAHYLPLLIVQGPAIIGLLSDPFGAGWNLLGTATRFSTPWLPAAAWIWHVQLGLIVGGHIVSVWLSHVVALRMFRSAREALIGQIPMLALMVLYTTTGLWLLSLPV